MTRHFKTRFAVLCRTLAILVSPLVAQDRFGGRIWQDISFAMNLDPVRKARGNWPKLGDEQIEMAKETTQGGERKSLPFTHSNNTAMKSARRLRRSNNMGVDAEKSPLDSRNFRSAFAKLIRRVDELIFTLNVDKAPIFSRSAKRFVYKPEPADRQTFPSQSGT